LAPEDVKVNIADISRLPFINEDLEANLPETVRDLYDSIKNAGAILLATPEYNRSYSPVLKNGSIGAQDRRVKINGRGSLWL